MSDIHQLETNLDLKQNLNVYASCKQLDTLHLVFNIFNDGLQADLSNYNVRLKAMKSDDIPLIQDTQYTVIKNTITIVAHEQLTTASGVTKIELQFINKTTGEKKATFNLNLKVIPNALEIDRSISTATYTLLEEIENKMDTALDFLENIDEALAANEALVETTNNANIANSTLNTTISTGNALKTNLSTANSTVSTNIVNLTTQNTNADNNISTLTKKNSDAVTNKNNLDSSIAAANTTKTALDESNTVANKTNTALNASNTAALATKSALETSNTNAITTKNALDESNDAANITKTNLDSSNSTANITKTNLINENVRAEENITAMQSFGEVTELSQNVTNLKTEIENARNGEVNLDTRLDKFDTQLSDLTYQVAGGTATVITLAITKLIDGYSKTFIASDNNNGNVTTINGKPLYKPNTTTAPALVKGKAYTVWYSLASDCFFIKASAEGNTIASHVLAGDTFSNDGDTGLVGTMPNNGALVITPGKTNQTISTGYHNGNGYVAGDADLIPTNIKSGANIFGVAGDSNVVDTSAGTATAAQMLSGTTAYVGGVAVTGTMSNMPGDNSVVNYTVSTDGTARFWINRGAYLTGSNNSGGYPNITIRDNNLMASNIRKGVNIFNVLGTCPYWVTGTVVANTALDSTFNAPGLSDSSLVVVKFVSATYDIVAIRIPNLCNLYLYRTVGATAWSILNTNISAINNYGPTLNVYYGAGPLPSYGITSFVYYYLVM